jgi:hypothetical protein
MYLLNSGSFGHLGCQIPYLAQALISEHIGHTVEPRSGRE